jgi:hypothetical protein
MISRNVDTQIRPVGSMARFTTFIAVFASPSQSHQGVPERDSVVAKIKAFAGLTQGWCYGEGGPIPQSTIDQAITWHNFLRDHGARKIEAIPGAGGEISLGAIVSGNFTEIIIEEDNTITIAQDKRDGPDLYRRNLTDLEAKELLETMLRVRWITYAGFTQDISINSTADLGAMPSAILGQKTQKAYHWLNVNASSLRGSHFVTMPENIIWRLTRSPNPQYIGDFHMKLSSPHQAK